MLVREYQDSDLAALRAIHAAQGFDYALPDLSNPLFVTKLVLTQGPEPSPVGAQPCPERSRRDAVPHLGTAFTRAASHTPACPGSVGATEDQTILGAALLRLTAEAYLLLDPAAGTPRERWQWLLALHAAAEHDAWQRGLEDVHAWLPPSIGQKFGKRLTRLGWIRDDAWTPFCKKLEATK